MRRVESRLSRVALHDVAHDDVRVETYHLADAPREAIAAFI